MGEFIVRQPNGLLARFSTMVDCPTHWNMTEEQFAELMAEEARERARFIIERYTRPFEQITEYFEPHNMTKQEFDVVLNEMKMSSDKVTMSEMKEVE